MRPNPQISGVGRIDAPFMGWLCYSKRDMVRFIVQRSRFLWSLLLGSVLLACSTDDDLVAPPHGPKDLRIDKVESVASAVPPEASLAIDCTEPLLVWIAPDIKSGMIGDFVLKPPGGCDAATNCGWMVIDWTSDADPNYPPRPIQAITSPVVLNLPPELRNGRLTLSVELRDYDAQPVMADNGKVLRAEFSVDLATTEVCPTG
jgi:hypothetical protein